MLAHHLGVALSQLSYEQFRSTFDRLSRGYIVTLEDGDVVYAFQSGTPFLRVPLEQMTPRPHYRLLSALA